MGADDDAKSSSGEDDEADDKSFKTVNATQLARMQLSELKHEENEHADEAAE